MTYGDTGKSVSVTATAATGHTITGYQWYKNTTNSNSGGTAVSGAGTTGSFKYLSVPTGVTAVSNASREITITWSKPAGATGYILYRKVGTGGWTVAKEINSNTHSYTDKKLTSHATYYYKLVATVSGGNSAESAVAQCEAR